MATRVELESALVEAHNAGDFEAANMFAAIIQEGEFEPETTALGALGEAGKRLIGGVATGTARVGTGLAELIPGVDDEAAQAVQRGVDEFVADKLAYDPAYDENYGAQLGEVVGEMAPMVGSLFLPGGAVTSATRLATMIGPAVSEGGMDRAEYEERTGEALSTAERLTAKGADVGLGMLERLGIPTRILKGLPRGFFDKPEANSILRRMESMIASGLQEGVQEVGQGIARDITTLAIYDPDRKIADSVMDDFALGGGAGAVLDLAIGLAQTPLKGRRGGAPKPIEEMTEEEIAEEQSRRDRFDQSERERREDMDATMGAADVGPQLPPEVREDPIDPTAVDATLPVEQMAGQVVTRLGSRLPVAKTFGVGSMDNKFYAEIDGEQFGPALEDPTVAQELSNRLTEASRQLGRNAEVEYVVENSGIEYTGQQAAEVRQLGRAIPSPQERIIRAEDANEAVGRDIASVINRQKADRGEAEAEVFTLEEVRAANRGDVGRLGDVLAVKDADFLAFRDDQPTPQAPLSPTQPRQPALGRRQQALSTLSSSFENMISSERAFTDLFASKRMDLTVNSEPFRGLVKRIIGKTPSKQNPLDNLSSNERRYLYHRVRKLPSFQEQATQIPDFSTKTPDGELVRIARRQIEVDQPPRMAVEAAAFGQTGQIPSQAEVRRVEEEARRTARPIERAGEVVPAGQEIVPYDLDQSALGQQLRDAIRRFGIDDQYATRMVEHVGNARRDSDGNIYILPIKKRDDGTIVAGSAQAGAKVIQVGLDAVMQDVNKGASYEDAVAKIMNHEILHALRAMDLFTAEEYSLLERLSRKYQKPGAGKTYGQWAVDMYGDISAVKLQEEAIAEMISDALTTGVVMDGDVKKPAGKPRTIFNKIVDFFKSLVGVAKDNDIDSFKTLVDSIQSGTVGRRERGQIRTPFRTELRKGEIADRGITAEDVGLETGKRGRSPTPRQVINQVRQELEDAPDVDTAMLSRRRAADIIDVVSGKEQPPKLRGKKAVASYLQSRTLERLGGVPRNIAREEDREAIADDLSREAIFEYENQASAVEWYNETIDKTIEMLAEVHPEIKKDPGSRATFLMSLAITSQNLAVPDNLAFAEQAYNYYKKNGKFKVEGKGDKKKSMESNFKKANKLLEKMTPVEIEQFLRTEFLVKDLNKVSRALLGKQADTGELAENTVYGSAIFGPKIGNGFYTNLRGDFSPVTMDMWFMRTMGRLSGTLMGTSKTKLDNAYKRVATAVGRKRVLKDAIERQAREIKSKHESDYRQYSAEFKSGKREKSEQTLAAENLIKLLDGTNDVPMNGTHRNQLRDITYRAIKKFEEATGVSIEPAAFQALIWYPEQDLYKSLGVNLRHVRQDYATSTEKYLTKIGVDRGRIKRAKDRVRRRAERRADGVRRDADVGSPDRRGTGRSDSDLPPTEQVEGRSPRQTISPEQADQAVDKNIASIAENPTGVPRFSVKASPEAQYIAQNPERALDADEPMYAVRGDIPAVDRLTKGPDREESNGKVFMGATNTGPLGAALTRLKAGAIFRYAGLEKYYQKVPGLRELEADSSAIAAALFADKSKAILASAVKYGVPVYQDGLTKVVAFTHKGDTYRGLIGVMSLIYNKDVGDLRKLAQAYAMVQRGDYLKGKNKLTPVDAKSRQEVLDAVEALTDADGYNPVTTWHEVWSAYNNRTIDFLKATGILNDQTADIWRGSSYIPFYRTGVSEDALPKVASNVFGDLTRMSEFRAYQGSDKAVDVGLIESVVLNLSTAIDMGMKNVAQQRITRDMQKMGLARQVKSEGAIPKGMNAIDFKVNGKKTRFEIDDNLIYDSMTSLTSGTVEQLATKYLGMPSNFLRELVTRDPGFMMANMLRDTLSTWTTSGASFVPVFDTFKGLGDGVERLEKLGVLGGYDFSLDKQDIVKFYEAENERRTESMNPLNMFTRIWDWAGKATTLSDAATRNAVYNDVLARTGNEAEAAFQAMEIINFARRGSHPLARVLVAAIPFLNARFQGLDVFVRAAAGNYSTRKDQPASMGQLKLAYRGGILAGLTTLYYLLVSDEDWYNEQDDYVREMNWLAPTESGVPIKFPIPFEVGLLYKTIPEAILASTIGNQSDRELRQTLQRGLVSTLEVNPLGVQAIAPLVEASLNHNFLTGRPVVPYYVDKITTGLQGNANTTQMATDIGKVLPISPLKIDHVARGYTGTIGSYLILTADSLYRTVTGAEDKRPARNIFEFPLWKRFFASKEGTGLRSDAYDLSNDITEVTSTINSLRKAGRIDELEAYIASRQNLLDIKQPVTVLKGRLDRARQQKERIKSSDMDENTKRQMLDDIDADLNQYLKVVPRLKELADAPFIQTTF
ncbi:MAG: hypothetical protein CML33_00470 [Rhodobacteraceae bacterium]|nr:hypothetical protein [Paracoccaceae bacterium]